MNSKRFHNIIYHLIAFATFLMSLSSCTDDSLNRDEPEGDNEVRLFVKISTAVPSSREADQSGESIPIEQMHSCRLIMIDKNGRVEKNIYAELDNPGDSHTFGNGDEVYNMIITTSGQKRFFLLANEESVGTDWYSEDDVVTQASGQTFTDWLSNDLESVNDPAAALNSVVFTPDYSKETGIPMSSFYEVELKPGKAEENLVFYLVRVATKFQLNFENYRNEEVIFSEVSVDNVADKNYILPHVGQSQQKIDNEYWIDWLKEAAETTTKNPDLTGESNSNDSINAKLGWLTDYVLPQSANINNLELIEDLTVEKATDQETPGISKTDYFYLPESKFDEYSMTFIVEDKNEFHEMKKLLPNVGSLFRDTYVIVNVRMYSGVEDIYVEIINWKSQDWVHGTVTPSSY